MRTMRTAGRVVNVELKVYDEFKYTTTKEAKRVNYNGVRFWEVVTGEDAEQIEAMTDGSCIDDLHEYLVITFENGESSTFRNSYVDMFIC